MKILLRGGTTNKRLGTEGGKAAQKKQYNNYFQAFTFPDMHPKI
ncbi:MAG TPA: hypothetical protein VKY33_09250 [Flavobacterium sp.]|nr:hypothetical protein [Flavobacterium sp.]